MDRTLLDPPEGATPVRSTPLERPASSPRSEQPNTPKQHDSQGNYLLAVGRKQRYVLRNFSVRFIFRFNIFLKYSLK